MRSFYKLNTGKGKEEKSSSVPIKSNNITETTETDGNVESERRVFLHETTASPIKRKIFDYVAQNLLPKVNWIVGSKSKKLNRLNYDICDAVLTAHYTKFKFR